MSVDRGSANREQVVAQAARARAAWRGIWLRLRGITPSGIAHALLIVVAVAAVIWFAIASWPALLPFAAGGLVAYTVLPVVNRLDGFLPRPLAALLTMGGVVGLMALIFWAIVPPLAQEVSRLVEALPSVTEANGLLDDFSESASGMPAPIPEIVQRAIEQSRENLRTNLNRYLDRPVQSLVDLLRGLLDSIGFVLGFLVIPTWLLAVLKDQRVAVSAIDRLLPTWLAPDFWAIIRLIDRVFGAFVRGRIVMGLAAGVCTWAGLTLVDTFYLQTGGQADEYVLLLAVMAGVFTLVPTVGPIVGAIVGTLIGLTFSLQVAALVLIVFVLAQLLVGWTVAPRIERRVVDLHPAILVMAITALSQFGLLWVFIAAPLVAIVRELFRYVYGRVSDPPVPAGVLPGERQSVTTTAQATAATSRRVPLVYRRNRATEQS